MSEWELSADDAPRRSRACRVLAALVVAGAAPLLPAGPLALLASLYLVVSCCYRVSVRISRDDDLTLASLTLLLSILQIAATAELLSLLTWLNLAPAWLAVQSIGWLLSRLIPVNDVSHAELRAWYIRCRRLPAFAKLGLGVFVVVAAANLLIAALAGITEYDSVTTYVPFVIDYCQQGSLSYPAHAHYSNVPGVWAAPVSFLMNWHKVYVYTIVLSNSMVMLNVLGWIATGGAFVATLAICSNLRLPAGVSLLSCIAVFSAPQFITQAANTMYDQIQAFTMAMVVLTFLKAIRHLSYGWSCMFAISHVAVMAMKLSWAFMWIVLAVLDVLLLITLIRRRRGRVLLAATAVGLLGLAVLVAPHFWRNLRAYGGWMPRGQRVSSVVDRPVNTVYRTLALRSLKCLIPYEMYYLFPKPPAFLPGDTRFKKALWEHVSDPYIMAAAYFGLLPLLMFLLLLYATFSSRTRSGRHARLLGILWSCFGVWIVFQLTYAWMFGYTPWNGRYMLICWFLAAPALAASLCCLPRRPRRAALLVVILVSAAESVDLLLQRKHIPIADVMNLDRLDHFRRDPRYPRSNIAKARQFLDEHGAYEVYTDLPMFFRLLYYDARRQRRIMYRENLTLDGLNALITNLRADQMAGKQFALHYETFGVTGDIGRFPGTKRIVAVPRGRLRKAPPSLARVHPREAAWISLDGVSVGDAVGGTYEGPRKGTRAWLGPGAAGSFRLDLRSECQRTIWLRFKVRKLGIALPDPKSCPITIYNGIRRVKELVITGAGQYLIELELQRGKNVLRFVIPQEPGPNRYYRDDRPTMLLVSGFAILPAHEPPEERVARPRFLRYGPESFIGVDASFESAVRVIDVRVGQVMGDIEEFFGTYNAWLGPREPGQLEILLQTDNATAAYLTLRAMQFGVALPDETRCPLRILVNEQTVYRTELADPGPYLFEIPLRAGNNTLTLRIDEDADEERYGDDPRPTMLYLTGLRFIPRSNPAATPDQQEPVAAPRALKCRPEDLVGIHECLSSSVRLIEVSASQVMGGVETFGGTRNAWLGPREPGQLEVALLADDDATAYVALRVLQLGTALPDDTRCPLEVLVNGQTVARAEIAESGRYWFRIPLYAGENTFTLRIPEDADQERYGLDQRPTMLYVTGLRFHAQITPSAELSEMAASDGWVWREIERSVDE